MIQYNDLVLSGSLNVKDGITGSLFGTASIASSVIGYTHTQTTASMTWLVTHSLGLQFPTVTIWSGNETYQPDTIVKNSVNNLTITFTYPLTGSARII